MSLRDLTAYWYICIYMYMYMFSNIFKPCILSITHTHRACFKSLPKVLCFNTMRYTFNMVTMMKEKVNTHFSFPLKLNMAAYTEQYLLEQDGHGGLSCLGWIFSKINLLFPQFPRYLKMSRFPITSNLI